MKVYEPTNPCKVALETTEKLLVILDKFTESLVSSGSLSSLVQLFCSLQALD